MDDGWRPADQDTNPAQSADENADPDGVPNQDPDPDHATDQDLDPGDAANSDSGGDAVSDCTRVARQNPHGLADGYARGDLHCAIRIG